MQRVHSAGVAQSVAVFRAPDSISFGVSVQQSLGSSPSCDTKCP